MKRALPMLVLLLVLAGVAIFTKRRAGGEGERFSASRAAELAPAGTVAFFAMPDFQRTVARWKQSELGAMLDEPEWQEMEWQKTITAWFHHTANAFYLAPFLLSAVAEVRPAEPAGFFVAVTRLDDRMRPEMVGGLSYRGKKADVEGMVRTRKAKVLAAWPGAKSELTDHGGVEIESIVYTPLPSAPSTTVPGFLPPTVPPGWKPTPKLYAARPGSLFSPGGSNWPVLNPAVVPVFRQVHLAFRDDWLFVATSRSLLAETLDRYRRKSVVVASLAQEPVFAEGQKHVLPEADLVAWTRALAPEELLSRTLLLPTLAEPENKLKAFHYSVALEGPRMRDRLYYHLGRPPPASAPSSNSLVLSRPDTQFHGTIHFDLLRPHAARMHGLFWPAWRWDSLVESLAEKNLTVDDLWSAFGPGLTLVSVDPQGPAPEYLAALEVRDAAKARKFLELSEVHKMPAGTVSPKAKWFPGRPRQFLPPMALTKTHFLIGFTPGAVKEIAARLDAGAPTLAAHPDYAAVPKDAPANEVELYLDTRKCFETNQAWVRPNLTWIFGVNDLAKVPTAAVARHLLPSTAAARKTGPGWLVEGSGTLGILGNYVFFEWALGLEQVPEPASKPIRIAGAIGKADAGERAGETPGRDLRTIYTRLRDH